jgi:hypothetical protein
MNIDDGNRPHISDTFPNLKSTNAGFLIICDESELRKDVSVNNAQLYSFQVRGRKETTECN